MDRDVPRKRCVVDTELFLDAVPRLFRPYNSAIDLTDALGRLTGFKVVEVKVGYADLRWRLTMAEEHMRPLHDALNERLAMKLGEVKTDYDKGRACCWTYHPRRG